jgi:hypothetical protein
MCKNDVDVHGWMMGMWLITETLTSQLQIIRSTLSRRFMGVLKKLRICLLYRTVFLEMFGEIMQWTL